MQYDIHYSTHLEMRFIIRSPTIFCLVSRYMLATSALSTVPAPSFEQGDDDADGDCEHFRW